MPNRLGKSLTIKTFNISIAIIVETILLLSYVQKDTLLINLYYSYKPYLYP
jgi:hypothetical protein